MTFTQTKILVLKEQMDLDPELKEQINAFNKLIEEFGVTEVPVYLKSKLDNIDLITKARMNSNLLQ